MSRLAPIAFVARRRGLIRPSSSIIMAGRAAEIKDQNRINESFL
jgi:hypothetical protein